MSYAELQVTSNFSFLRGASHPEELVLQAHALGLEAIALTDRNTLAGVVRAHCAAKEVGIRFVVGARLDLLPDDAPPPRKDRMSSGPFDRPDETTAHVPAAMPFRLEEPLSARPFDRPDEMVAPAAVPSVKPASPAEVLPAVCPSGPVDETVAPIANTAVASIPNAGPSPTVWSHPARGAAPASSAAPSSSIEGAFRSSPPRTTLEGAVKHAATSSGDPDPGPGGPANPRALRLGRGRADPHRSLRHDRNLTDRSKDAGAVPGASGWPALAGSRNIGEAASELCRSASAASESGRVNFSATCSGHPDDGPCDPGSPRATKDAGRRTDVHHGRRHDWKLTAGAEERVDVHAVPASSGAFGPAVSRRIRHAASEIEPSISGLPGTASVGARVEPGHDDVQDKLRHARKAREGSSTGHSRIGVGHDVGGGQTSEEGASRADAAGTRGAAISLLCFPTDRAAYGRLAQLISTGQRRVEKGLAALWLDDVLEHAEGQILVVLPPPVPDSSFGRILDALRAVAPGRVYLAAQFLYRGDDRARIERLAGLAERHRTPLVATGDVLYHTPARRPLQDVLSCIHDKCTIDEAGLRLHANAERHLKPADEMARLFRRWPEAVARTAEIVQACRFSLDELRYDYPIDPPPDGLTEQAWLERLTWEGAALHYPDGVPDQVRNLLLHEFRLIEELRYAPYFLTVHDIVRYARSRGILCQGRGSAANSAVCYCLGITAVDPGRFDLLFERFVSAERNEPPDIDVDFEHERREEVIQYIYGKHGREHAGIAATVIHYRTRSAIREVGKALGLSADVVGGLAGSVWGWSNEGVGERDLEERGMDPGEPRVAMAVRLSRELIGFPRHLSQHVGGFVLTRSRLDSVVPVLNGAMPERTFVEWDKDDLDALGILKIDVLGLGMLTCIRKAFELLGRHYDKKLGLATVPPEDPQVYQMLSRGDSLGVFQVESRAQMTMLPRLKPACFYDLIVEVAIVRPGPIQGDMVHPYLRRRAGLEPVVYPSGALKQVLEKTLGVPLFQEQAMKIAIIGAGFTPTEADRLRRAMATFKRAGTIDRLGSRFIEGMVQNGYERAFAEKCFRQIEGFGTYGFPESHAASFALLVYVSSWIKCHYPEVFAAALLNSQPMGFYAPAQIVRDARDHGVTILPVEVNASDWDTTLEVAAPQALDTTPPSAGASPAPSRGCIRSVASDASGSTSSIDPTAARSSPGSTRGCPGSSLLTAAALPVPGPGDPRNPRAALNSGGRADSHHSLRHPQNLTGGNEETVKAHTASRAFCFSETAARCAARTRPPEPDSPEDAPPAAAGRDRTGPGATHGSPVNRSATSSDHPERGPCDPGNPRAALNSGGRTDSHHSLGRGWIMADEAEETVKQAAPPPFGLPAPGPPQGIHRATPAVDRSAVGSIQASPVNASATSFRHPEHGPCDPGNPCAAQASGGRTDTRHGRRDEAGIADASEGAGACEGMGNGRPARTSVHPHPWDGVGSAFESLPKERENAAPAPASWRSFKGEAARFALRLGFRQVKGLKEDEMRRLVRARGAGYADLADLRARARLGQGALDRLARADAFGSLALDRRGAIWTAIGLDRTGHELDPPPLFAWADRQIAGAEPSVELPAMTTGQHVAEDYRTLRLTLRAHPLALLRPRLPKRTIRAADLVAIENGRRVEAAGLVLVRQRPGTASGVIFVTLEDETGVINLVVWPKLFERFRRVVLGAQMMTVKGEVQKDGLVIHVIAGHLADRTDLLRDLSAAEIEAPVARADRFKRPSDRRSPRPTAKDQHFATPLAHADHAKSSGGPDSRDPFWRPRDIDHHRSHPHLFPAPLARADEAKRNTRNTQPSPEEHGRRHPHQAAKLKGFNSRDFR